MCRRCGEPDRRGNNRDRRRRKQWLLNHFGDGKTVECALKLADDCPGTLTLHTVTAERMIPGCQGGSYRHSNLLPACLPCNIARGATDYEISEGCVFG